MTQREMEREREMEPWINPSEFGDRDSE